MMQEFIAARDGVDL
jgi:hypothetical protein